MNFIANRRFGFAVTLLITAAILTAATTYAQVNFLGVHFLRVQQEKVHLQMLQGLAGNPWQYRILADLLIEPLIRLVRSLGIPQPASFSFIAFRVIQCLLILITAGIYYRKLGLSLYETLIGLSVLAWSMSYSLYNSDLSFNNFFDVAFYLIAAILIIEGKYAWLVLLMIPAALNRETSVLVPLMAFGVLRYGHNRTANRRLAVAATAVSLLVFVVIFVGLRLYYGKQPFLTADGYYPGIGLLALNLQRWVTWEQLSITLGVIPLLAIFAYRHWPQDLRIFFWVVVPIWLAVHFVAALVAETRLLLVPQALVLIPGALFELAAARNAAQGVQSGPGPTAQSA
ncbi:MAG TPA: hypothetical protein VF784_03375 [Anaerolineales bacterium]